MTASTIVPFLFIVTISAVVVFAYVSKRKTEQRMKNDNAPISTLAEDAPERR